MKKIIFLMPVYNDWKSVIKLLDQINIVISDIKNYEFECIIVDDCSTAEKINIVKPKNLISLEIINMAKNQGHARCNATGLRFIKDNKKCDYVIVMDSDGEDRPIEIKDLINKINEQPETSVVAKRVKRSEGLIFQMLYRFHKFLTFIFTGKKINFGNYCCLTKEDLSILSVKHSLWCSFSGSIKKHLKKLNNVNSIRGTRYYGPSKMSLINLMLPSFSIIAVFKYLVLLRSFVLVIILWYLSQHVGYIAIFFQLLIVIFNLIIFAISLRENKNDFFNSNKNILNVKKALH